MKKIVIWSLSATILAVLVAAGFFYYQSSSHNSKNIAQKSIASSSTMIEVESASISINNLPPEVQLQNNIEEHKLDLTLTDKAILKVYKTDLIYKNKINDTSINKIEIINNNNIIFTKNVETPVPITEIIYYPQNFNFNKYAYPELTVYNAIRYETINQEKINYILYDVTMNEPDIGGLIGNSWSIIKITSENSQIRTIELYGYITETQQVGNNPYYPSKLDKIKRIEEGKYITSIVFDHYFNVAQYYEVVGNRIQFADKEFPIERYLDEQALKYQKDKLKKQSSTVIYTHPDLTSASQSVNLSENTKVTFLGLRHTPSYTMIHVNINGTEGWVEENKVQELGVGALIW